MSNVKVQFSVITVHWNHVARGANGLEESEFDRLTVIYGDGDGSPDQFHDQSLREILKTRARGTPFFQNPSWVVSRILSAGFTLDSTVGCKRESRYTFIKAL